MTSHKSIQPFIWIFAFLLLESNTSFAKQRDNIQKDTSGVFEVETVETGRYFLFIYNSDSIMLEKSFKEYSCLFQLKTLHQLFFTNRDCHAIKINEITYDQKGSKKKKKYFNAKGFVSNSINQYEWIIRVENPNAMKNMNIQEFLINAGAALIEIKIRI